MIRIVTLGPKNTYSDVATQIYCSLQEHQYNIVYARSITNVLDMMDNNQAELAVLPIENLSEGYISVVLDHLIKSKLYIKKEILLPIKFSLISNKKNPVDIKKLFVQFVAKGQCSKFIDSMDAKIELVLTESNIESLNLFLKNRGNSAAIVPTYAINDDEFNLKINNINDFKNNQTRFLVLTKENNIDIISPDIDYKTTIIVIDDNDYPGFLGNILSSFSKRKINLTSITSRPTKGDFGKYYFLIDLDGHMMEENIKAAINEINSKHNMKNLGSYIKAKLHK
ncbi:prephenate dehydratase [Marinomonas profundimaris]|uniref:prephenate dehydratase n=1 Tax=Marinomonas profundimaris TaxID=1208321 RepID=W1RT28_9GAMM|nr:prephenate dehydratase domain-containing protein [Marinomonas profundimaris]ETI60167.1 prephenate dehydratase [Marinomonas profundimaris]